jgi:hypothetical protein
VTTTDLVNLDSTTHQSLEETDFTNDTFFRGKENKVTSPEKLQPARWLYNFIIKISCYTELLILVVYKSNRDVAV